MRAERDPGHHAGGHPSPRPSARFGSGCGRAPVAPLPPPRRTPSRNASPSNSRPFGNTRSRPPLEHHQCVKVGVSQVRKSWCLLTHASISWPAKRELASISGSDEPSMRQFGIQIRPACVYCTFGMRHIRRRRTRGMRPFRIRPSRLASVFGRACVYFGLDSTPACVHFAVGRSQHASNPTSEHQWLASIFDSARPACVHCTRGMRQFPSRLNPGMRLFRSRLERACVNFSFG